MSVTVLTLDARRPATAVPADPREPRHPRERRRAEVFPDLLPQADLQRRRSIRPTRLFAPLGRSGARMQALAGRRPGLALLAATSAAILLIVLTLY